MHRAMTPQIRDIIPKMREEQKNSRFSEITKR